MPISNYNLKFRLIFTSICGGLVLFIYGLSTLPEQNSQPTYSDSGTIQQSNQTIIVNSTSFKISMGGMGGALLSMMLLCRLTRAKEEEEFAEDERIRRTEANRLARVLPLQTPIAEKKETIKPSEVVPKAEVVVAVAPEKEQKQEPTYNPRVTFMEPVAYQPRGPVITYLPRPHLQQWLPPNWQYQVAPYVNRQNIPMSLVKPRPLAAPRPLVTPRPFAAPRPYL